MSDESWQNRSDYELLRLIKENKEIFDVVYRKYVNLIYRFCFNKVGYNKDLAEDLTAETFLKALKSIDKVKIQNDQTLLPWLYTIARNTVYSHFKKIKKQVPIMEDIDLVDKHIRDIDKEIDNADQVEKVNEIVQKLSNVEQDILYMKINDEMTFKQIASVMNMGESAVKMKYYRLLNKIKKTLLFK